MNVASKFLGFLLASGLLLGCDAVIQMDYVVENASPVDAVLFVPNYPTDTAAHSGPGQDTILRLPPRSRKVLRTVDKFDFPWAHKSLYRDQPGICGLLLLRADYSLELDCTEEEWEYHDGESILVIE